MHGFASPAFRRTVAADLRRYGDGVSLRALARHVLRTPGFRYTLWMRLASRLRERAGAWLVLHYACRFAMHRCGGRFGISIPYDARIGEGFYIGHWGGIVVHPGAVIGRDCNISHGVTIGEKFGGRSPGVPVLGDRVYLGPGCTVIGGIRIGSDAAVGANSVVLASVPERGVVAGVPAKLRSLRGSGDYIMNTSSVAALDTARHDPRDATGPAASSAAQIVRGGP